MKFITKIILYFLVFFGRGSAWERFRTSFIDSFILNEQKPTFVIFCDLCWNQSEIVFLANGISNTGIRVSSSLSIKDVQKHQDHALLFLLDIDCPKADQVLYLASSQRLFSRPYRWLILSNSTDGTNMEYLWNCPLLPDSDLVLAGRTGDQYSMVELHKASLNHSMVATARGFYNGTFMDIRPRRELYRRRMNLLGHPLTMSNVIQDSNKTQYHLPREDGLDFQNDATTKICWMIAKVAFLMLNATPRYTFSYRWGYKVNGQWSGMINDLNSGKADVGTNCVVSNPERLSVVTYTDTLSPYNVRFVFRQPPLTYVSNIYSLPFSTNLWLGTAVCAAVSAAAITVAARWELRFGRNRSQMDGGISDAVFLTMSAVSQQGCDMEPRRTPGRIVEWVMFTALMALYAAYSANIVVLLQAPSNSIRTLSQLASSKLTLAAYDVDYSHFIFSQFKDPVHVAIGKRVYPEQGKKQLYSMNEGVERIRQGLFAYHAMDEQIYRRAEETFYENEKCDLMEIDYMNTFYPYVPIKKDSPYLELIRVAFKRIRETGIQSGLNRRHLVPKPRCSHKGSAFSSVGILDLHPVMLLMLMGAGTSVLILLLEIAVFNAAQKMQKRSLDLNQPRIMSNFSMK